MTAPSKELLLDGVRVLDMSRLLPGPFCSMLLADMGADVLKVEDPRGGDGARAYPPFVEGVGAFFGAINRNKRSVAINLKTQQGQAIVRALVKQSDVVLESFRPGVLDRLGLGHQVLRELNPKLIVCAITGWGQTGALAHMAGHDLNFVARAGLLEQNAHPDADPVPMPTQVADLAGGALFAALGITSALYRRTITGQGTVLDISMTDGAVSLQAATLAALRGASPRPGAQMLTGGHPRYRIYACAQGGHMAVASLEPKFWQGLCDALQRPDLVDAHDDVVGVELTRIFATRTREQWTALFKPLDVCVEPVLNPVEAMEDHLFKTRELFFTLQGIDHTRSPLTPLERTHTPAPALGQHTDGVLRALGYEPQQIEGLRAERVVG